MRMSRLLFPVGILTLLFLNLAAAVLIKLSPCYYGELPVLLGLLAGLVAIYGLVAFAWLLLGRRYQLSYVYPLLSLNYVLSLVVGMAAFHEPFNGRRWAGALVIVVGVAVVSRSKHRMESASRERRE